MPEQYLEAELYNDIQQFLMDSNHRDALLLSARLQRATGASELRRRETDQKNHDAEVRKVALREAADTVHEFRNLRQNGVSTSRRTLNWAVVRAEGRLRSLLVSEEAGE